MKKVILIGGGGHAISILELIKDHSIFLGYADVVPNSYMPIPYLGEDAMILREYPPHEYEIHHVVVYTKEVNLNLRARLINRYKLYPQHTFIAETSVVTPNSQIGQGTAVMHRAIVNRAQLGESCIINTGAVVEHSCHIGNNVFIGPGAIILGDVTIGDNCLIGAGAVIRDGISICSNTIIGMGTLVTRDITDSGTYWGKSIQKIK